MANEFCEKCLAESTSESAGSYTEGMFGRQFMGNARPCPTCKSFVATLWQVLFHFPLRPVDSYRYKPSKGRLFFSRKIPLDEDQVRSTRLTGSLMAIGILAVAGLLIYLKATFKRH